MTGLKRGEEIKGESDFCWKNATHDQEAGGNGTDDEIHVRLKELVV